MSGIYKIYCKDTNKYYIGQSVDVKNRLKKHLSELKSNKHINQRLQEDFNICGEDAFIFEKIKDVEEEFLNIFEKYYIEYYRALEEGYNVVPMNNLIKDKYKNKNSIELLKNIDPIEVPLIAGDIYAYELFTSIKFIGDFAKEEGTTLTGDIKSSVNAIKNFLKTRHIGFWKKCTEIVELELRRKFNRLGIIKVELGDVGDVDEFLLTKIFKAEVWTDKDFIEIDIKCTK